MPNSGGKTIIRMFESEGSQTLRIPFELAYDESVHEVEIERTGDMLLIRPVHRKKLTGIGEVFSMFSPGFMAGGREFHESGSLTPAPPSPCAPDDKETTR